MFCVSPNSLHLLNNFGIEYKQGHVFLSRLLKDEAVYRRCAAFNDVICSDKR